MSARAPFHTMTLVAGLPMLLVGVWSLILGTLPLGFFFALLFIGALQVAQWQHDRWLAAEAKGAPAVVADRRWTDRVSGWISSRPRPLVWIRQDRKRALICGLWLVAAGLILADLLFLRALMHRNSVFRRGTHEMIGLSATGAMIVVALPIPPAAAALLLQVRWHQGARRAAAAFALAVTMPALALPWLAGAIPSQLDSIRVADGRQFLAVRRPFDLAALEQVEGPFGIYWRRVEYLAAEGEGGRLIVSPDGKWLAFGQAGELTQCFRVAPKQLLPCDRRAWAFPAGQAEARQRSEAIARITGVRR